MDPLPRPARRPHLALVGLTLFGLAIVRPTAAQNIYATPFFIATAAGSGAQGSTNATGTAASFNFPNDVAVDSAGNLYVADSNNFVIRKISSTLVVTTLAGQVGARGSVDGTGSAARFDQLRGITVDGSGNLFVADFGSHVIRKVTSAGVVTTVAGLAGNAGVIDGTGNAARFNLPRGIAVDSAGNIFVTDSGGHTIRKITPAGVVTTLAGSSGVTGLVDGAGSAARFNNPDDMAIDSSGNLYVADNVNNAVRKITPAGVVTTLAGSLTPGNTDATGSAARFRNPVGITVDSSGTVFVGDDGNNLIRKITPAGVVTTVAGLVSTVGTANGLANVARFDGTLGLASDASGNLYIADARNNLIRRSVSPPAFTDPPDSLRVPVGTDVILVASGLFDFGPTTFQWKKDGVDLPAFRGTFGGGLRLSTLSVAFSAPGTTTSDAGSYQVTLSNAAGTATSTAATLEVIPYFFTTLAGSGVPGSTDATGSAASFNFPNLLAVDGSGNFIVADTGNRTIRRVTPAGVVTTVAGLAGTGGSTDGNLSVARFSALRGVAVDPSGNILVADTYNHTIRKITPAGVVSTLAGQAGSIGSTDGTGSVARFSGPFGIVTDRQGNCYVTEVTNKTVRKITPAGVVTTIAGLAGSAGSTDGVGSAARFSFPRGVTIDSVGTLIVADAATIRFVTPSRTVGTLAGLAGAVGNVDGPALTTARFQNAVAVARDVNGNIYVADDSSHTIRKISPAGQVTTIGGLAGTGGSVDGAGSQARFSSPDGIAVDAAGNLYIAEAGTHRIRRSVFPPVFTQQPSTQSVVQGQPATFSVSTTNDAPVTFQWRRGAFAIAGATNATFTIGSTTAGDAGSYTVVASNAAGSVVSLSATLTVSPANAPAPPTFTAQPLSRTATIGSTVQFTASAVATSPLSFQWRKDGTDVAGATTSQLTLNNVGLADAGSYTMVATASGLSATSNAATLTVVAPVAPTIATQPASQSVALGGTAAFNVEVSPLSGTTFQWRKESTSINGATTASLTINNVTANDAGSYSVVVTNSGASVTSDAATLTVNAPPIITTQPANQTVAVGASAQFSVVVTPTIGTTFQWIRNGAQVTGATNASFTINSVTLADAGFYSVAATNAGFVATSIPATLVVNAPAGSAPVINVQPTDQTSNANASISLSVSASGSQPLSFQWLKNGAAISGATAAVFVIASAQPADEGSYSVVVSNTTGTAASSAANVRVIVPPSVATQPASQSTAVGSNVQLSVAANGTSPLQFQWRKAGAAIAGATSSTLTLNSVQLADASIYSVTVTNTAGFVNSAGATVDVLLPGPSSRLSNLSVRTSLTAGQIVIVGIAVDGGSRDVLLRAVGPGLSAFGLGGVMVDPRLELFRGQTLITANDDWPAALAATFATAGAFPLTLGSRDAAFRQGLDGAFSIQARGTGPGVVLVEAYDLGTGNVPRMINVSARNRVGTGDDILIAGFTITGTGTKQLLIRGVGPGLAAFGVPGTLFDPRVEVFNSTGGSLAVNDNWAASLAPTFTAVGAFGLTVGSRDAALVTSLPPGSYTVQVRGADGGTGEAIVEVYEIP